MANFIELTSNKSGRPVLVNARTITWVSTGEASDEPLVTVLHFAAAYAANAVTLTVKEGYDAVTKKITA
jgi:hypothetical protein